MKTIIAFIISGVLGLAGLSQSRDDIEWGIKYNTSGAVLRLKELGRTRSNGQTVVAYRLFATGLPKNVEYTLWTRLAGEKPRATADAYINRDGLVVNVLADPANGVAEDPIDLQIFAGRGEPKLFGLISDDARYRAFGQETPFPIESSSGPCRISATMVSKNYFAFSLLLTGLQPLEEFEAVIKSGDEGNHGKFRATEEGSYTATILPTIKGQVSGKFQIMVAAKSCQIGLEMPWGEGSYAIQ